MHQWNLLNNYTKSEFNNHQQPDSCNQFIKKQMQCAIKLLHHCGIGIGCTPFSSATIKVNEKKVTFWHFYRTLQQQQH